MKTKLKIFTLICGAALLLPSCEKWFDVTADDQVKAEDQFASADGFKDALVGIYLSMGTDPLYGLEMSFNLIDILSQQYAGFTSNLADHYAFETYNYKEIRAEGAIKSIWDKYYFSLANVNSALTYLDKTDFPWYTGEKEIIKGELLALRAYLHFDLMRVFGHSNYANRPELSAKLAIPYTTTYNKDLTAQVSYSETFKLMEQDLNDALVLLKYDPSYKNTLLTPQQEIEINRDGFYDQRNMRFNYYAVKALQARIFAWQGGSKMQLAAQAAEEVINDSFTNLLKASTNVNVDRKMSEEQLFSLDVARMFIKGMAYFEGTSATNYNALRMASATTETIFETAISEIGAVDVRYNTLLLSQPLGTISLKYRYETPLALGVNTIPLIKLPEMYYIAAEYYSQTDLSKAISLLDKVRSSRRIISPLSTAMTISDFEDELLKEYRKEFISEGQLFFYYKRRGFEHIPDYTSSIIADDNIYMLPYPASEVEFGNRVQ